MNMGEVIAGGGNKGNGGLDESMVWKVLNGFVGFFSSTKGLGSKQPIFAK